MVKTARKTKSIPLSLGCNQKYHAWWNTTNPTGSGYSVQTEECFHNSIYTADSAEGGKQASPSHKARAHCWLRAVQANMLRGTVTFPFTGTQVPHVRPYQAVSCSVNWQTTCCKPSMTPSLTAYTMAVSEPQHRLSLPGNVYDQSTKYWLTGGKKQINLSQYDKW